MTEELFDPVTKTMIPPSTTSLTLLLTLMIFLVKTNA